MEGADVAKGGGAVRWLVEVGEGEFEGYGEGGAVVEGGGVGAEGEPEGVGCCEEGVEGGD